jgi:nicotinamidase/pyrazinamidase
MLINPTTDILGLVDIQPTFMPGGELPVPGGDEIVPAVNGLLGRFEHAFATQDWHPARHASFASAHPGRDPYETIDLPYGAQVLWPDHAIAGSPNAAIHHAIDQARIEMIVRKGFRRDLDSYSAFFENDRQTPTGLEGWLRQRGFQRLFLCGLATDFCVAWSAEDAANLGLHVVIVEDACRGIGLPGANGQSTIDAARDRLAALGVSFIQGDTLKDGASL